MVSKSELLENLALASSMRDGVVAALVQSTPAEVVKVHNEKTTNKAAPPPPNASTPLISTYLSIRLSRIICRTSSA